MEELAPTRGKLYLKVDRKDSYGMWGSFDVGYMQNELAQVDRSLYGGQAHYESGATTSFGEQRLKLDAFGAEPGTVPSRQEFRGTGGSFYITKGGQQNDFPSKHSGRVLKISPDGKKVSVFASGLRNAYLSIRPGTDEIYASDQQGHWVPATPVHRIVEGGYYGFKPAAPWGVPEPEITPPLCWIPHAVAGSGLGSVWADKKRFGPLSDSLIYIDFRRPGLLRTYLHDREGQAATVPLPTEFAFPLRSQQIRYLAIHPQRSEPITEIEFIKGPDQSAPVVMAVTLESSAPTKH